MEHFEAILVSKRATQNPNWKDELKNHIPNLNDHIIEMIELNNHKGTNFFGTVLEKKLDGGINIWHQHPFIQKSHEEFFNSYPENSLIWGVTAEDTNF